ncbi:DUF7822 domain-containing protein [Variovorax sp.]|jgi:hypothetical protein|uniref:DUF7822 domain-containing protein n=1 Tax=Variovorax sp. TaxID=1871043 RepID=UPI0011FD5ED9|nr:hypothetical protein [Variovorax sp.]TAJ63750.1 MAG: hypothetical protein EPO53_14260 [Variovorax sp.]
MANRSYLYASAALPDAGARPSALRGISEYAYDVPLVFRLLVSCETRPCRSAIWDEPEPLALAGRCGPGIARVAAFLARIDHPAISPMREDALRFLAEHTRPDEWFVLEPAEVLSMGDAPVASEVEKLRQGLADLDAEIERTLAALAPRPKSFWQRLLPPAQQVVETPIRELGLGHWSDTLYFSFDAADDGRADS